MVAEVPRLPLALDSWEELNRRCASVVNANIAEDLRWRERAAQLFTFAGYLQMATSVRQGIGSSIGAGWNTLVFDVAFSPLRGGSVDLGANTITIDEPGIWLFGLNGTVRHNEQNQGREMNFRIFNVTDNAPAPVAGYTAFTGRNTGGTPVAAAALFAIDAIQVGDQLRFEVGGTSDSYSLGAGEGWKGNIVAHSVGEWQGEV